MINSIQAGANPQHLATMLARGSTLQYSNMTNPSIWARDLGPENPLASPQIAGIEDQSGFGFVGPESSADGALTSTVPMNQYDPAMGGMIDIWA